MYVLGVLVALTVGPSGDPVVGASGVACSTIPLYEDGVVVGRACADGRDPVATRIDRAHHR